MVPRYWVGLVMFCMAAVFTAALGSLLQYRAMAQREGTSSAHSEAVTASLPLPTVRRSSFGY